MGVTVTVASPLTAGQLVNGAEEAKEYLPLFNKVLQSTDVAAKDLIPNTQRAIAIRSFFIYRIPKKIMKNDFVQITDILT